MKTVAIVSEFDPFHNGHRALLEAVRRQFGEDTEIVALMSGNFTQRGTVAVADKFTRAAMAVEGGVNLVLEIPFPYSLSSAEYFARAGVRMASALNVVDTLAFGSECGDIGALTVVAKRLSSPEFEAALQEAIRTEAACGYAALHEQVYRRLYDDAGGDLLKDPNNILAISYLREILALPSPLTPFTVKRRGAYHEKDLSEGVSATAVRAALYRDDPTAYEAMPPSSAPLLRDAMAKGMAPTDFSRLENVLLAHFRTRDPQPGDALGHRIYSAAIRAHTFQEFTAMIATKRYTHAYIRRTLWHRFFGITSADCQKPPLYTQILGMDARGRAILRRAAKSTTLLLLTKPADGNGRDGELGRQIALAQKADSLYPLTMPVPGAGNAAILAAPYRKD
ncbi:MAG: nucleotidyltransferase family protein [Clostridia bacterium]|nr:nucleotidyltransferase family protein [Clostridia bacterium]